MSDPVLHTIARKHNKSAAQIMLRYQIQRDVIVIPKSVRGERIKENSQVIFLLWKLVAVRICIC